MSKKKTKRIYQGDDGRWRLETIYTTGRVCASICGSKEAAERLLNLSETYTGHFVEFLHNGKSTVAKVTNTGVLEHRDGTLEDMLYVRLKNGTYLRSASDCTLWSEKEAPAIC
jgi:hypothetical protein